MAQHTRQAGDSTAGGPATREERRRSRPAAVAGLLAALAATALWGFTFVGPVAVAPVNVYYLVMGRYTVFGAVSLAVLAVNAGKTRALGVGNLLNAMHLGAVGYVGFYLLLALSAQTGGGVLASTMTGLIPVTVALVSNFFEKALAWHRLALPVAVIACGLLLVNGVPTGRAGPGNDVVTGAVLGFASCAAWTYFVIVNRMVLQRPAFTVDNTVWTAGIGLGAFCGSLLLVPRAASAGGTSPFSDADVFWSFLAWCVALAALGSWFATWFWNFASKRLPSALMGPIVGMEAVFGALSHLAWEGRPPTLREAGGGLLVTGGVFLCSYVFDRFGGTPPARSSPSAGGRQRSGREGSPGRSSGRSDGR
ncbi:DMT family transporter [Streptomyces sp. MRC013]|uniref:DMT family transporter n=1 Tax=Streptomyces sp. MRC013 TaxID=2898276 RepID=UPI002026882C|nr:DMT family transporter [Streptomyces sp. MRC013]URM88752.1 DMT family transporter [Streptomyces sp. MRC013]